MNCRQKFEAMQGGWDSLKICWKNNIFSQFKWDINIWRKRQIFVNSLIRFKVSSMKKVLKMKITDTHENPLFNTKNWKAICDQQQDLLIRPSNRVTIHLKFHPRIVNRMNRQKQISFGSKMWSFIQKKKN